MQATASSKDLAARVAFFGVAVLLAIVPLAPGRETLGGLPLDTVILTVPLAVALALPYARRVPTANWPRFGFELPAVAFLAWPLVTLPFVGDVASVLLTWTRFASYVLLVPIVALVAADSHRRRLLYWTFAVSGSITVGHGFYQYVRPGESIGMEGLATSVSTRVFATFENPNFYAEFLVLVFAVTLALLFTEKGLLRAGASFLLAAQAIALLLTYTRGSWLALAVGLALGILMIDSRLIWPFAVAGAAMVPFVPGALDRVLSIFSLEGTASFRLRIWKVAGAAIAERPLTGWGIGRFYDAFRETVLSNPQLNVDYLFYGAHNSFFQLGAETGIPGALAFLWLVVSACRMGVFYNARMAEEVPVRLQNAALTAGLVAFALNALTSNAFQHPRAAVFFFALAGMQAGLGERFWNARVVERRRGTAAAGRVETRTVVSSSAVAATCRAAERGVASAWHRSLAHRMLVSEPIGGGRLVASSRLAQALDGGPAIDDRPNAAAV